ncbi:hypothetical protein Hanom_Chr06g00548851 [Helianthus anomalus]
MVQLPMRYLLIAFYSSPISSPFFLNSYHIISEFSGPFPEFIMQFFHTTGLSFAQTMPMVWRVLMVLGRIKIYHIPDLCIEDIPISYRLRSHGSSRFLLFSTSNNLISLKVTKNEDVWK